MTKTIWQWSTNYRVESPRDIGLGPPVWRTSNIPKCANTRDNANSELISWHSVLLRKILDTNSFYEDSLHWFCLSIYEWVVADAERGVQLKFNTKGAVTALVWIRSLLINGLRTCLRNPNWGKQNGWNLILVSWGSGSSDMRPVMSYQRWPGTELYISESSARCGE